MSAFQYCENDSSNDKLARLLKNWFTPRVKTHYEPLIISKQKSKKLNESERTIPKYFQKIPDF